MEAFDYNILSYLHQLAVDTNGKLNLLMKIISLLGDKGFCMFLIAGIMFLRAKTRKNSIYILGAVALGTLIGNGFMKFFISRTRPFEAYADIKDWWIYAEGESKWSTSFPSGHVMAVSAGMLMLFFLYKKIRYIIGMLGFSFIMGVSRCYRMVHYPTDIIGGFILGIFAASIAWVILNRFFEYWEKKQQLELMNSEGETAYEDN